MSKELLVAQLVDVLLKADFVVSTRCDIRPSCFDLAARGNSGLILIKVLSNIDGLKEESSNEMKLLALHFNATAMVVGIKTRDHSLESNVVYMRHGIPTVNLTTFTQYFIEGIPPLIYAAHGGLYVHIDGEHLRKTRIEKNISLGELAAELGVSRRTVSKYEEQQMDLSVEIVCKLEEFLDEAFATGLDLLKTSALPDVSIKQRSMSKFEFEVIHHIMEIGFEVIQTTHAPFEAISHDGDTTILTGISDYNATTIKKAHIMSSISNITNFQSVFIVNHVKKLDHIGDTVLIKKKEFEKLRDASELTEYIEEIKN